MITRGLAGAALLAMVAGCSTHTVKVEDGNTIVADATKRLVITSTNNKKERIVCAEPSPDAMASIALAAAAKANIPDANVNAEASGTYARNVAALGLRTASIQILRDLGYRACEGVINNVIDDGMYKVMIGGVTDATLSLVAIEGLTQMQPAPLTVVASSANAGTAGGASATVTPTSVAGAQAPAPAYRPEELKNIADSVVAIVKQHYEVRKLTLNKATAQAEKSPTAAADAATKQ